MRLSKSFAFLPTAAEHTDTSTGPAQPEESRSSLDSFVIPRRTRFPSSKQDKGTTDFVIIDPPSNSIQHTDIEQVRDSTSVEALASPRKRRGFFSADSNKENKIPKSVAPSKALQKTRLTEKRNPAINRGPLVIMREPKANPDDPSTTSSTTTLADQSRRSTSTFCLERPGSMRSAKEYNLLARQYKLPEFDYNSFHHHASDLGNPKPPTKNHSFFGKLLSKRASTLHLGSEPKRTVLKHSRSTFNFLHIEAAYKDVLANRSLEEISRIGGLHTLKLPREYSVETYAVPTVVSASIGYLLKHGMTTPGIFRVSGQKTTIDALYSWYSNMCIEDDHDQRVLRTLGSGALPKHIHYNSHDVASLLKKFIGGLHGGLLGSAELFKTLNGALTNLERQPGQSEESFNVLKGQIIALLISSIPNAKQMHLICAFFGLTAAIGEETKRMKASSIPKEKTNELMGHRALGVVFGPLLLADLEAELDVGADRFNANRPAPSTPRKFRKEKRRSQVIDTKLEQDIRHRQALLRINVATNLAYELLTNWIPAMTELRKIERRRNHEYINQPSSAGSLFMLPRDPFTSPSNTIDDVSESLQHVQNTALKGSGPDMIRPTHPEEDVAAPQGPKYDEKPEKATDKWFFGILGTQQQKVKVQPREFQNPLSTNSSLLESQGTDADDEMDVEEALRRTGPSRPWDDRVIQQKPSDLSSDDHSRVPARIPSQEVRSRNEYMRVQREPNTSSVVRLEPTTSPVKRRFNSLDSKFSEAPPSSSDREAVPLSNVYSDQRSSPERLPNSKPATTNIHSKLQPPADFESTLPEKVDLLGRQMGSPTISTFADVASSPEPRKDSPASSRLWETDDNHFRSANTTPEISEPLQEGHEQRSQRGDNAKDHVVSCEHENANKAATNYFLGDLGKHNSEQTLGEKNGVLCACLESAVDPDQDDVSVIEPTPRPRREAKGSAEAKRPLSASFERFDTGKYQVHNRAEGQSDDLKPKLRANIFSRGSSTQAQVPNDSRQEDLQHVIKRGPLHGPGEVIPPDERLHQESFNKVKDRWVSWSSSSGSSNFDNGQNKDRRDISLEGVTDANLSKLFESGENREERRPRRESVKALAKHYIEEARPKEKVKILPETPTTSQLEIRRKPLPKMPTEGDTDALNDPFVDKGNAPSSTGKSTRSPSADKESRIPQPSPGSSFNSRIRSSGRNLRHSISPIITRARSPSPTPRAPGTGSLSRHPRKSFLYTLGGSKSNLDLARDQSQYSPPKRIKAEVGRKLDRIMSASPDSLEGSIAPSVLPGMLTEPEPRPVSRSSRAPPVSPESGVPQKPRPVSNAFLQQDVHLEKEGTIGKSGLRDLRQPTTTPGITPSRLPADRLGPGVYRSPPSGEYDPASTAALYNSVDCKRGGGLWDHSPRPLFATFSSRSSPHHLLRERHQQQQQQPSSRSPATSMTSTCNITPSASLDSRRRYCSSSLDDESANLERSEPQTFRHSILRHIGERGITLREYSESFVRGHHDDCSNADGDGDEEEEEEMEEEGGGSAVAAGGEESGSRSSSQRYAQQYGQRQRRCRELKNEESSNLGVIAGQATPTTTPTMGTPPHIRHGVMDQGTSAVRQTTPSSNYSTSGVGDESMRSSRRSRGRRESLGVGGGTGGTGGGGTGGTGGSGHRDKRRNDGGKIEGRMMELGFLPVR